MKNSSSTRSRNKASSVRIIGGEWRRRTLPVGEAPGLRPTGDRIRETLFNWLMPHIHGATCLDLFAGTGALGIEALSRGAKFVQFAENNRTTATQLQQNLSLLKAESLRYTVLLGDGRQCLTASNKQAYNIVFLDPPFDHDLWQEYAQLLQDSGALAQEALIYVETAAETKFTPPESWIQQKSLKAGSVVAWLYQVKG